MSRTRRNPRGRCFTIWGFNGGASKVVDIQTITERARQERKVFTDLLVEWHNNDRFIDHLPRHKKSDRAFTYHRCACFFFFVGMVFISA